MIPRFRFTLPVQQRELEGVHRRELSRFLILGVRRKARGCLGAAAYASLLEPVDPHWRFRARREVRLLASGGWQLEGQQLLAALAEDQGQDNTAVEVISLAIEIWPAPDRYLALGQALLAAGRAGEAQAVYSFLFHDLHRFGSEASALGWRIREGLAAAWEALGKDRVARGCLATCLDDPASGGSPLVGAFFLALELGRSSEARQLGQRLDVRYPGPSKRLEACLESLSARLRFLRAGSWVPPAASASTFGQLIHGRGAAARTCRRLVGLVGDTV